MNSPSAGDSVGSAARKAPAALDDPPLRLAQLNLCDAEPPRLFRRLRYLSPGAIWSKMPTDAAFMSIGWSSKVVQ